MTLAGQELIQVVLGSASCLGGHGSHPAVQQRWGEQGNRARVLFPFPETVKLCFRRKHVLDWALEGTADHPLCTLSWELGGVLGTWRFLARRAARHPASNTRGLVGLAVGMDSHAPLTPHTAVLPWFADSRQNPLTFSEGVKKRF